MKKVQKYYNELIIKPNSYNELFLDLISTLYNDAIEIEKDKYVIRGESSLDFIALGVDEFAKELSKAFNENIFAEIEYKQKLNQDWVKKYQDSIVAIQIDKFYIRPSWFDKRDDLIDIIIEPSLAFGSGHHESTKNCIKLISKYSENMNKDFSFLDVGCGSGILGLSASKLGAMVDLCDTDIESIKSTKENFQNNQIDYNFLWEGSITNHNKQYDFVVANIVADVLIFLAKDLKARTKDNGYLLLSGIMNNYKDKVLKKYNEFLIEEIIEDREWVTILLKNNKE